MSLPELAALLGVIAGCLISLGIIWTKGVLPLFRWVKRVDTIYDRLEVLPEWCDSVDSTLKELKPNGGASLKDTVNQTHAMLREHLNDEKAHNRY